MQRTLRLGPVPLRAGSRVRGKPPSRGWQRSAKAQPWGSWSTPRRQARDRLEPPAPFAPVPARRPSAWTCRDVRARSGSRRSAPFRRCGRHTSPPPGRRAAPRRRNHGWMNRMASPPVAPQVRPAASGSAPARSQSSAVVGSSAMMISGVVRQRHGDAGRRWRMPARQLVRIAVDTAFGVGGCAPVSEGRWRAPAPRSRLMRRWLDTASISWSPTV